MQVDVAASRLAELGHSTRLEIYRFLVRAGSVGAPVSDIKDALDVPGSTLSHHISKLTNLDLVTQVREGRVLHCIANYELLDDVIFELKNQCCVDEECEIEENKV